MAIESWIASSADALHADDIEPGACVRTAVVGGWQWVRLAHFGAPRYVVLLKISPDADEHDAVRALEWWLSSPGREDGDVVEVI